MVFLYKRWKYNNVVHNSRYTAAITFFEDMFRDAAKNDPWDPYEEPRKNVFVYETCATDTENMTYIEGEIRRKILSDAIHDVGLL